MKTRLQAQPSLRRRCGAVTLVELLITMVTTVVILGGALAAYVYGLKMMQFTQPKLRATEEARKVISVLTEEIRSATDVQVGDRKNNVFVRAGNTNNQTGSALRIYPPPIDPNRWVIYYSDPNEKKLKRTTNNTTFTVLAEGVSNEVVFAAEDFKGKIKTNHVDNFTVAVTLQFCELTYPRLSVGSTNDYYDWYQLRSKITRRAIF